VLTQKDADGIGDAIKHNGYRESKVGEDLRGDETRQRGARPRTKAKRPDEAVVAAVKRDLPGGDGFAWNRTPQRVRVLPTEPEIDPDDEFDPADSEDEPDDC
jgi:hypothetical protein